MPLVLQQVLVLAVGFADLAFEAVAVDGLFEILFEKEKNEQYQPRIPVTLNNFFLHLFRIIISPNAP